MDSAHSWAVCLEHIGLAGDDALEHRLRFVEPGAAAVEVGHEGVVSLAYG